MHSKLDAILPGRRKMPWKHVDENGTLTPILLMRSFFGVSGKGQPNIVHQYMARRKGLSDSAGKWRWILK